MAAAAWYAARSASATTKEHPPRSATRAEAEAKASGGSPAMANQAPSVRRRAPRSGSGIETNGWMGGTSGVRSQDVEAERAGQVSDHGGLLRHHGRSDGGDGRVGGGDHQQINPGGGAGGVLATAHRPGRLPARPGEARRQGRPGPPRPHHPKPSGARAGGGHPGRESRAPDPVDVTLGAISPVGASHIGGDVGEGGHHEPALPHPGVGHLEVGLGDGYPVDPDDVDIEGARPPPDRPHPIGRRLQAMAHPEQLASRELGVELHHDVEERRLSRGPADGVGPVDGARWRPHR